MGGVRAPLRPARVSGMPDDPTAQVAPAARCMWCSAVLPSADLTTCPSCGATLIGDGDTGAAVPGLTAIDADAILRNARAAKTKSRGGLLGWISGDYEGSDAPTGRPESLAPPSADVRREMLRLELEAQVANAQAEVEAMAADEAIEEGRPIAAPEAPADASVVAAEESASADEAPPA